MKANRIIHEYSEFAVDDIVEQNGHNDTLLRVSGVIRDKERLIVLDDSWRLYDGREFEIHFSEVTSHWRKEHV